jgi:hypothetical protein
LGVEAVAEGAGEAGGAAGEVGGFGGVGRGFGGWGGFGGLKLSSFKGAARSPTSQNRDPSARLRAGYGRPGNAAAAFGGWDFIGDGVEGGEEQW